MDLTPPAPGAGGALRSSIVTFRKGRASAIARNCVHGFRVENAGGSTRLHTNFEQPLKAHVIRDWASNHPKLVAPVLVFLVGAITYTASLVQKAFCIRLSVSFQIFDPLRILCVEGKLLDWFDYRRSLSTYDNRTEADSSVFVRINGLPVVETEYDRSTVIYDLEASDRRIKQRSCMEGQARRGRTSTGISQ